ncbi:protease [Rhodocytophaga rosea]|uniref:Protease n=1 Tax=Rhodocytophaga rosea TaxID=2704465 RepID=A0A6C0GQT0_9BACT|nr:M57 family metalloprotease [Rhodocytophaga rosea]QHT70214.1 protease [Rhodocytophaga rosea]
MKIIRLLSTLSLATMVSLFSCQKEEEQVATSDSVSEETLSKIHKIGFSTQNVQRIDEGYLIEGDIVLTEADLNTTPDITLLRAGTEEQYRTTNLVKSLPRNITVSISSKLPSSYVKALDEALARYNAQNLTITFTQVSSGANISIVSAGGNFLASAGFPTSGGAPYGQIKVNSRAIGNQPQSTVATILAHELGHCIGFRHTDYMNRSYSCGGQAVNEGASSVGAIQIPGTPSGPDAGSWMLSCIGSGQNRPFNNNDRTALNYLY